MKQIFLISYHLDGVTAGPSVRFQRYAPLFMEQGYRLTFITRWHNAALPPKESKEHYDVRRIRSNSKYLKHTFFIFKALCSVCFMRQLPEALLTFSCNTFQLWIMPLIKIRGVKLIYISTMSYSMQYIKGVGFWIDIYNKIHFRLYQLLFSNLWAIVTSSDKLAEYFIPFRLSQGKVVVIHNGVNTQRFKPVEKEEKQQKQKLLGLPHDGRIILYVGLKTERKGLTDLIEAWNHYHKRYTLDHLLLVGNEKPESNTNEFNNWWESEKQKINSGSTGVIMRNNSPEIENYFQAADLFIFLSHKEGMPNVLLEAMACGLPVIITTFQGFSEVYGLPGKHMVVVERDPTIIAKSIEFILQNQDFYQSLHLNALDRINQYARVERSVESYVQLFSK